MQWSIRGRLIFGGSAMIGTFMIAAFVAHVQTRLVTENLTQMTVVDAPLKDAALEMEINLLGTGFAALGYFQDNDPGQRLPPVTISLGLALYRDNGTSAQDLLRSADSALYEAKHAGRDRLAVAAAHEHPVPLDPTPKRLPAARATTTA